MLQDFGEFHFRQPGGFIISCYEYLCMPDLVIFFDKLIKEIE